MNRIRSSIGLGKTKLSFRRKNKDAGEAEKGGHRAGDAEAKENDVPPKCGGDEANSSRPQKLVRTPSKPPSASSSPEERDCKRRRVSPPRPATPASPPPLSAAFGRHTVVSVELHLTELHLLLRGDGDDEDDVFGPTRCVLRGSWAAATAVSPGDAVHVLADWSDDLCAFKVDDAAGLLVVDPDRLVSGTSVVSSLFCMRKAVLSEWFKGLEGTTKTMFVGTLVHELLQEGLKTKATTLQQLESLVSSSLSRPNILQDLIMLNMSADDIRKEVEPFLPHILYFTEKYVLGKSVVPPPPAFSSSQGASSSKASSSSLNPQSWPGVIEEVSDIEENIWSPRLGLKGKVDLTVKVKMKKEDRQGRTAKVMPLELKTGRASGSAEHKGQVILYSMMMSERRPDPGAGLLLYLRNSSLQEVNAGVHEMRGLVQLRNELVSHLKADVGRREGRPPSEFALPPLPEPLNLRRHCSQCPHLLACSLGQRLGDAGVSAAPHAMAELVPQATEHLTQAHLDFYRRWSVATTLEKQASLKASKLSSLWCQTPSERERRSLALANLSLEPARSPPSNNIHVFVRPGGSAIPPVFAAGETVLVSSDRELVISQGVVVEATPARVRVGLDRDLRGARQALTTFHLDRHEYQGQVSLVNLAKLMEPKAEKLRKIVIDKSYARFCKGLSREVVDVGKKILRPLNKVQQKAIFRTLMAEEYVLLRGMPGTGKTTLIVALVRVMAALGKTVLLTSYTHSAVDNILMKLRERQEQDGEGGVGGFLRIGRVSRIHPSLREFSADHLASSASDPTSLGRLYRECPVVAATCLGAAGHPAVAARERPFDYCVVDEAGQAPLLSALGPLLHANKFVLVGDPKQLPPVVQSDEAKRAGLDVSLFEHLEDESDATPNVVPLNVQYRMNSRLAGVANELVYGKNGLVCGTDEVASRCMQVKPDANLDELPTMFKPVLDASVDRSVVFLDTSASAGDAFREAVDGQGVRNEGEARLVLRLCETIGRYCAEETSVGVIAPYRAQVAKIRNILAGNSLDHVEVNTVDQFQGRDKDVIVYSCTRSNRNKTGGNAPSNDILGDIRRLNVAVTRARRKLVMVGDRDALKDYQDTFGRLFGILAKDDFVEVHKTFN